MEDIKISGIVITYLTGNQKQIQIMPTLKSKLMEVFRNSVGDPLFSVDSQPIGKDEHGNPVLGTLIIEKSKIQDYSFIPFIETKQEVSDIEEKL